MLQWDYTILRIPTTLVERRHKTWFGTENYDHSVYLKGAALVAWLNTQGAEGWEAFKVEDGSIWFKRKKEGAPYRTSQPP